MRNCTHQAFHRHAQENTTIAHTISMRPSRLLPGLGTTLQSVHLTETCQMDSLVVRDNTLDSSVPLSKLYFLALECGSKVLLGLGRAHCNIYIPNVGCRYEMRSDNVHCSAECTFSFQKASMRTLYLRLGCYPSLYFLIFKYNNAMHLTINSHPMRTCPDCVYIHMRLLLPATAEMCLPVTLIRRIVNSSCLLLLGINSVPLKG